MDTVSSNIEGEENGRYVTESSSSGRRKTKKRKRRKTDAAKQPSKMSHDVNKEQIHVWPTGQTPPGMNPFVSMNRVDI